MSKLSRKKNKEATSNLLRLVLQGYSAQQILTRMPNEKLSISEISDFITIVANEIKNAAPEQRVILRQALRDSAPDAIKVMRAIMSGQLVDDINTLALKLRAAENILKYASKFVEEDVLTGWYERPLIDDRRQTIFEFGAEIDPTGATVHYIKESDSTINVEAKK